jgi:hypothetical protein
MIHIRRLRDCGGSKQHSSTRDSGCSAQRPLLADCDGCNDRGRGAACDCRSRRELQVRPSGCNRLAASGRAIVRAGPLSHEIHSSVGDVRAASTSRAYPGHWAATQGSSDRRKQGGRHGRKDGTANGPDPLFAATQRLISSLGRPFSKNVD